MSAEDGAPADLIRNYFDTPTGAGTQTVKDKLILEVNDTIKTCYQVVLAPLTQSNLIMLVRLLTLESQHSAQMTLAWIQQARLACKQRIRPTDLLLSNRKRFAFNLNIQPWWSRPTNSRQSLSWNASNGF